MPSIATLVVLLVFTTALAVVAMRYFVTSSRDTKVKAVSRWQLLGARVVAGAFAFVALSLVALMTYVFYFEP